MRISTPGWSLLINIQIIVAIVLGNAHFAFGIPLILTTSTVGIRAATGAATETSAVSSEGVASKGDVAVLSVEVALGLVCFLLIPTACGFTGVGRRSWIAITSRFRRKQSTPRTTVEQQSPSTGPNACAVSGEHMVERHTTNPHIRHFPCAEPSENTIQSTPNDLEEENTTSDPPHSMNVTLEPTRLTGSAIIDSLTRNDPSHDADRESDHGETNNNSNLSPVEDDTQACGTSQCHEEVENVDRISIIESSASSNPALVQQTSQECFLYNDPFADDANIPTRSSYATSNVTTLPGYSEYIDVSDDGRAEGSTRPPSYESRRTLAQSR